MDKHELSQHYGHKIEVAIYGDNDSVTVECMTCCEVLFEAYDDEEIA